MRLGRIFRVVEGLVPGPLVVQVLGGSLGLLSPPSGRSSAAALELFDREGDRTTSLDVLT